MSKFSKWIKDWNEIKTIRANTDGRERKFARELRKEFETGERGDAAFIKFVEDDLHEPLSVARYLLALDVLAREAPGDGDLAKLGLIDRRGQLMKTKVRYLMHLPVRDQVQILEAAKKQNKVVQTIINDRERAAAPKPPRVDIKRVAAILDEHWEALERAGIPLTEIGEFVAQYAKKVQDKAS